MAGGSDEQAAQEQNALGDDGLGSESSGQTSRIIGDPSTFREMDEPTLLDAVIGIVSRVFADSLVADGLAVKIGDRYFTPECAPEIH